MLSVLPDNIKTGISGHPHCVGLLYDAPLLNKGEKKALMFIGTCQSLYVFVAKLISRVKVISAKRP
jgi:hypothetical protein